MTAIRVNAETTGVVWQVLKQLGDVVQADEALVIVESMKMEIPLLAPAAGRIVELRVEQDQVINEGDLVAILEPIQ